MPVDLQLKPFRRNRCAIREDEWLPKRRPGIQSLGPNVGIIYRFGSLGLETETSHRSQPEMGFHEMRLR